MDVGLREKSMCVCNKCACVSECPFPGTVLKCLTESVFVCADWLESVLALASTGGCD